LAIAVFALPAFLGLEVIVLFVTTSWTDDALRPTESGHGINADLFIAKVLNRLLQGLGLFHSKTRVQGIYWLVKYIITDGVG
jgi:hypothetical protein